MERRCPDALLVNVSNPLTALCRAVTTGDLDQDRRPVRRDRGAQVRPQPPLRHRLRIGRPRGGRSQPSPPGDLAPHRRPRRVRDAARRARRRRRPLRDHCGWSPRARCTTRWSTPSTDGRRPTSWPTTRSSSSSSNASASCPDRRTPMWSSSSPGSSRPRRTTDGIGRSTTTACTATGPTRPTTIREMADLLAAEKIPRWPSGEFVAPLLDGLVTGEQKVMPANIPNTGQVENLARGRRGGVHGRRRGRRGPAPGPGRGALVPRRAPPTGRELAGVDGRRRGVRGPDHRPRGHARRSDGGIASLRARCRHDRRALGAPPRPGCRSSPLSGSR